jgi:hypothetical protein
MAIKIDPRKATKEQIEQALALLEKAETRKEKIKSGEIKGGKKWSELTDAEKDARRLVSKKRNAKIAVIMNKALAAGITCSDKEIEAYLAKK